MNISFEAPYYNFNKSERVETIAVYNQFINWVIGEFDLCQIEECEGLKVYFANGYFSVDLLYKSKKYLNVIIKIKSKTLNDGKKIENILNTIFSNLKKLEN